MNLIERAGSQLRLKSAKSLIEKAADRLGQAGSAASEGFASAADLIRPAAPPQSEAEPQSQPDVARRETRRQITIDFDRLRAGGFALPRDQSGVAEEFRLIKRPLVNVAVPQGQPTVKNHNVIMVTSAIPGEGKTFVSMNLAFSMASEHDVHVLLIDADVAKPSVPGLLGFEADTGLIDVVSDPTIDLANVMVRTNIENLTLLPSGRSRPGSSELLASGRMARFVDDVSRRYADRIIIFDSPPVLARSEPIVLAKHVGQVVFVVEAERTSRTAVDEAIALLGPERIGGIVLNKAPSLPTSDGFGQHYRQYS